MFKDREDAGAQLATLLSNYKNHPNAIVIGLPRGGVVTGYQVAKALNLPLDITCPRKIGAPDNLEYAIGAITETGEGIFHHDVIRALEVSEEYLQEMIELEKKEAQHRLDLYRKDRPPIEIIGKLVILVDDGLATGSTMQAAIRSIKSAHPAKIVVAVPVAPPDTLEHIRDQVDEVVCISAPPHFYAVGQFYDLFGQTEDDEVIDLMSR